MTAAGCMPHQLVALGVAAAFMVGAAAGAVLVALARITHITSSTTRSAPDSGRHRAR